MERANWRERTEERELERRNWRKRIGERELMTQWCERVGSHLLEDEVLQE